jgi:hypothetical protein
MARIWFRDDSLFWIFIVGRFMGGSKNHLSISTVSKIKTSSLRFPFVLHLIRAATPPLLPSPPPTAMTTKKGVRKKKKQGKRRRNSSRKERKAQKARGVKTNAKRVRRRLGRDGNRGVCFKFG